jgi:hypothetical protein
MWPAGGLCQNYYISKASVILSERAKEEALRSKEEALRSGALGPRTEEPKEEPKEEPTEEAPIELKRRRSL